MAKTAPGREQLKPPERRLHMHFCKRLLDLRYREYKAGGEASYNIYLTKISKLFKKSFLTPPHSTT